jgi:hypothetical protein
VIAPDSDTWKDRGLAAISTQSSSAADKNAHPQRSLIERKVNSRAHKVTIKLLVSGERWAKKK